MYSQSIAKIIARLRLGTNASPGHSVPYPLHRADPASDQAAAGGT